MKKEIDNLYFAKCRMYIMDYITNYYQDKVLVTPRPDYVDYYTILYKRSDGNFVGVGDNKNNICISFEQVANLEHYNRNRIILEIEPLANYLLNKYDKFSNKECQLIQDTIIKTKKLDCFSYGYRKKHYI